ncbi:MAG: M23 family metallopeptidase [Betaproteobacteria bacterium]|nr:M23 family metallopeptidase [Betaproteobacteria bacterium]
MQLIWISGPTSKLTKVAITGQKLLTIFLSICLGFLILGAVLYFMGIRIAIDVKPELVRAMGGVISESEQLRVEAEYNQKLHNLAKNLSALTGQIDRLKKIKDQFSELATPVIFKIKPNDFNNQGGPSQTLPNISSGRHQFSVEAPNIVQASHDILKFVESLNDQWDEEYKLLKTLPTGEPLVGKKEVSSTYGMRIDPFHKGLAFHSGVDFNAAPGTPILAAGDGVVLKVDHNDSYGNYVEVLHLDDVVSKYAHASGFVVQEGQKVLRGQKIGVVGSTGRSTGPHLHFEVIRSKSFIDPLRVLVTAKEKAPDLKD